MTRKQTEHKKLTARNSPELAQIKKWMNKPIFQRSVEIMKAEGRVAVRTYLATHFRAAETADDIMEGRGLL